MNKSRLITSLILTAIVVSVFLYVLKCFVVAAGVDAEPRIVMATVGWSLILALSSAAIAFSSLALTGLLCLVATITRSRVLETIWNIVDDGGRILSFLLLVASFIALALAVSICLVGTAASYAAIDIVSGVVDIAAGCP